MLVVFPNLVRMGLQVNHLSRQMEEMMADVAQIQADIAALQDAGAAAGNELQTLADQVTALVQAGAGAITQDQLDTLHDSLQNVVSTLTAATQSAQTQVEGSTPPPAAS